MQSFVYRNSGLRLLLAKQFSHANQGKQLSPTCRRDLCESARESAGEPTGESTDDLSDLTNNKPSSQIQYDGSPMQADATSNKDENYLELRNKAVIELKKTYLQKLEAMTPWRKEY